MSLVYFFKGTLVLEPLILERLARGNGLLQPITVVMTALLVHIALVSIPDLSPAERAGTQKPQTGTAICALLDQDVTEPMPHLQPVQLESTP
jgi:hypothetical protein